MAPWARGFGPHFYSISSGASGAISRTITRCFVLASGSLCASLKAAPGGARYTSSSPFSASR
jgi:hypothetical protein